MSGLSEASSENFARSMIPLYHNACVTIRISSSDHEYKVSKDLLCRESKYFSAMFEGKFKEGVQQTAILEEVEGIVSVQSLEAFLQWIYLGKFKFDLNQLEHHITATIELARFADMCNVSEMATQIGQYLKDILVANPCLEHAYGFSGFPVDTCCLTSQHIISATFLPQGHVIRRILAAVSSNDYLLCENHKFAEVAREYPNYGFDLLQEVGLALKGLRLENRYAIHKDPITGETRSIHGFRSS
ncbi:hypothetical protein N7466_011451 [Penicillium verhagenii]|uniref:uncharacterized protein n=1 Tax=Penicillium verhagenii TaxID=1562060 RepID=UPI0025459F8C|nr:uncharacterized protein N7466_011451 [Penicillium verhagenii]KAJ5915518.1 hypothetical protein N7466_011451 [Penicillium verhagenii]